MWIFLTHLNENLGLFICNLREAFKVDYGLWSEYFPPDVTKALLLSHESRQCNLQYISSVLYVLANIVAISLIIFHNI